MTETEIQNILEKQHKFFQTGQTLPVNYRIEQLKKLKDSIIRHEPDLNLALKADLGKSETESYMCEVGLTLSELSWMLKHIKKLTKEKWVPTPLAQFAAKSFRSPSPYAISRKMFYAGVSVRLYVDHESVELPGSSDTGTTD